MIRKPIIALALTSPLHADVIGANATEQDFDCTDTSGDRVELGQTVCLCI